MMRTPRRQRAYDLTDGRCTYCHARLADDEALVSFGDDCTILPEGSEYLCVTLKKPRSIGGRGIAANEVPACHRCSALKAGMDHDAFLSRIGGDGGSAPTDRQNDTWMHLGDALCAALVASLAPSPTFARGMRASSRNRSF